MPQPASHTGQRVIVTAGASGIGRVTADAFAAAGARVFICDVDDAALAEATFGDGIAGIVADVSDEASVDRLFTTAIGHLGGIDILVNNAGIAGPTAPLEAIALDDWHRCLGVNLDGAFLCSKAAIPTLKSQRSGSIVNLSSTGGLFGFPNRSPYASAKWAIRGLTKTLACELGPYNVRCNCICPGSVEGDRIDRVIAKDAAATGRSVNEVRDEYASQSSLRTFVSPHDIAAAILFLTSDAGARISGQELAVDGHTQTL